MNYRGLDDFLREARKRGVTKLTWKESGFASLKKYTEANGYLSDSPTQIKFLLLDHEKEKTA